MNKQKGFTLVELVVVMAIIALLVALALFLINATRQQARNTTRRNNATTVKGALEAFFSSNNCYPQVLAADSVVDNLITGTVESGCGANALWNLKPFMPGSVDSTFTDPLGATHDNRMCYFSSGAQTHTLYVITEPPADVPGACAATVPAGTPPNNVFSVQ